MAASIDDYGSVSQAPPQGFVLMSLDEVDRLRRAAKISPKCEPPEGWALVPMEPTPGRLMSMALRCDHALGFPGYYDQEMLRYPGGPTHQQRLDSAIRDARAQYEEVVGTGFYCQEREAAYAAMLTSKPGVKSGEG